jgi:hypothetical protein
LPPATTCTCTPPHHTPAHHTHAAPLHAYTHLPHTATLPATLHYGAEWSIHGVSLAGDVVRSFWWWSVLIDWVRHLPVHVREVMM